jgi:predicted HTH transcriptional regulator
MNKVNIEEIFATILESIESGIFIDVEKSKVELKDLSNAGEWKSFHETVCAFLNTDGGFIFCGIKEANDKSKYKLTGFDRNTESKLIELHTKLFSDDNDIYPNLTDNIQFDYYELLGSNIAIVKVVSLRNDLKFLKYKGKYYERKLTADTVIEASRIAQQKQYKAELEYAKEISTINNASIKDLSLSKINDYIDLINKGKKNETKKATLKLAKSFLDRKHFMKEDAVTTLGMLVCGEDPFHFLEYRSEVDCYYDRSNDISGDKQYFKDDVLTLMDESFRFVWGRIKLGRTYAGGGKSIPEYSEELIREIVNNALAHRDYEINKFITINIEPSAYIEIKNPGTFKERIKITDTKSDIPVRRIIAGIPESKNPKLADVLKVFEKIESQGRGMSALVNSAIENKIDMPYYDLKDPQSVTLVVQSGKLVDEGIEYWINGYKNYIEKKLRSTLTNEYKQVLAYFKKSELLNANRKFTILLSESNNHVDAIVHLKKSGLIFEHPVSTEENPVYILDREIMKDNFANELIKLYGEQYLTWSGTLKEIMNIVFRYTIYNETPIRPVEITPEIYLKESGKFIDPKKYESLGRKVRKIISDLQSKGFIINKDKGFVLNLAYKPDNTLF